MKFNSLSDILIKYRGDPFWDAPCSFRSYVSRGLQPFAATIEYKLTPADVRTEGLNAPQVQVSTKVLPEDDLTVPDWESVCLLRTVPISATMNDFARIYDEYYRQRFHPLDNITNSIEEWINVLGEFLIEFSDTNRMTPKIFNDLMIFFGPIEGSMKRIQAMIKRRYFYRKFTRKDNNREVAHAMLLKREVGTFFWRFSISQKNCYVFCYNAVDEVTGKHTITQKLVTYEPKLRAFVWRSRVDNKRKDEDEPQERVTLYESIDQLEAREPEFKKYAIVPWDFGVRPDITYAY
jgi:hypothetical protein